MKINYFDLGIYHGEEIEMFIKDVSTLNIDYEIYGFDAFPNHVNKASEKFKNNPKVHLYNYAISDKNENCKLYLHGGGGWGNSIYSSKNNVNKNKFIDIESISIVDWIINNVNDYKTSFNIIRFNIEGAELLLIQDIVDKKFIDNFNLYLGSIPGVDIKKVKEIEHRYDDHINLLAENNIEILPYCKGLNNINLTELLREKINMK